MSVPWVHGPLGFPEALLLVLGIVFFGRFFLERWKRFPEVLRYCIIFRSIGHDCQSSPVPPTVKAVVGRLKAPYVPQILKRGQVNNARALAGGADRYVGGDTSPLVLLKGLLDHSQSSKLPQFLLRQLPTHLLCHINRLCSTRYCMLGDLPFCISSFTYRLSHALERN